LKPQLDARGIGIVLIGLEELGVQTFIKGGFFSGGMDNCFYFFVFVIFLLYMGGLILLLTTFCSQSLDNSIKGLFLS